MATATIAATSRPVRSPGDAFSGATLAAGAAALFVGTLFYARLTPALGLPALPDERRQALADVLSLGAQKLALAGGFAFFGDLLVFGACMALAQRRRRAGSDLHAIGWALIAVSAAIAMVFDSMTAALFWPLAHGADPGPFLAFKAWFDFLFAAADIPFGIGFIATLWADAHTESRLLTKPVGYFGMAVGAAAAISGFAYVADLAHLPLVIGLTVTLGCVVLAALGGGIARTGYAAAD
jgi:hypothetical protein